ncbi:hypothetical protein C3B61_15275 [Cryobacterium zongtaii]|uniref:Peptidoglycan binding-like domain-containing protein n=1 Tax=Cryobacterium zongtaii TaxID=1259217 RepID=A0A2S3ZC27_9MICO|nr:hypothetical protein [Cryobacterium zongtaii]POH63030.1 hypothetical protein C3B61_15275 [Cryobacterium zongtaii]
MSKITTRGVGILTVVLLSLTASTGAWAAESVPEAPPEQVVSSAPAEQVAPVEAVVEVPASASSPALPTDDSVTDGAMGTMATPPRCGSLPRTSTAEDGVPGSRMWALMQCLAKFGDYTGPIDGVMGPNSWRGVQYVLSYQGVFTGTRTGVLDTKTMKGLQLMAEGEGFSTGGVNGAQNAQSWRAIAGYLNKHYAN